MSTLLSVKTLVKDYNRPDGFLRLYNGLSFGIDRGDFLAVTGGSGWGKSTLVNIILGIEKPSHGSIHHEGRDVTGLPFMKRFGKSKVAAVFQRSTSLPQLTVNQNLNLALSLSGVEKKERQEKIDEALAFFGLENFVSSFPENLSAGQRRRVDLARALAVRSDFLILDEPVSDLDTSTTNLLLPLLKGMNRTHGTTVLMTSAVPRIASVAKHQVHLSPPTILTSNIHKTEA
jgi:ABC-type lipoprotein export system ATPase subunit